MQWKRVKAFIRNPLFQCAVALAFCMLSACALPDPTPSWMQNAPKIDQENGVCSTASTILPDYGGRGGGKR
jgi:hypothetical protein